MSEIRDPNTRADRTWSFIAMITGIASVAWFVLAR